MLLLQRESRLKMTEVDEEQETGEIASMVESKQ
jgi:hypothetical protein